MRFSFALRAKTGQVSVGNGQGPAFLLSPLGDLMTLFINFSNAARPFGVAVLSRISASLPTYSPMVIRFFKGHPYMNQGSFRRFLSFHQQDLYKGTHLCQNWALVGGSPQPSKNMDIASSREDRVELETRIFAGNRYTTAVSNQP